MASPFAFCDGTKELPADVYLVVSSNSRVSRTRGAPPPPPKVCGYSFERRTAYQRVRFSDTQPALLEKLIAFISSQSDDSLTPNIVFRETIKSGFYRLGILRLPLLPRATTTSKIFKIRRSWSKSRLSFLSFFLLLLFSPFATHDTTDADAKAGSPSPNRDRISSRSLPPTTATTSSRPS